MSVFNPECTSNYFQVQDIDPSECTGGNPYASPAASRWPDDRSISMAWTWATSDDEGRDQQGDDAR